MALADKTIGEIVAEDYRTAQVFERHRIDFCCGGHVPLAEVCRTRGISLDTLASELEAVRAAPLSRADNYAAWDLPFLVDYILNVHHHYLSQETPQILAYAEKIAAVHGQRHPEVIEIAALFRQMAADLDAHLREEETVLFPLVRRLHAGSGDNAADRAALQASLAKLSQEHDVVGEAMHRIRHLAMDYAIPDDVCNTYRLTYHKLAEFEDDLHKHVHLENNILFPKAALL